ncbi:formyltransferase family protein [Flavobacterium sp. N1994]|uniref:formyltransferase family protein n=1 Tax=Flavobacterium sp. N1994 TaxID=2986827 RepID=UPI0022221287|nr:formyltransferase family protein [Flavobacterium sp. N1994]
MISQLDFVEIVGVCSPVDDKYLTKTAHKFGVSIIPSGSLKADTMPDNVDIGITAHSFDYIGRKTRYKAKIGWIGYHPSLLPRHRGRSSIEWAIRMRDPITGGSVFWLNDGIDRGDIAYQDWVFIDPKLYSMDPKKAAKRLWEYELQDMGLRLIKQALIDINAGKIIKVPQDARYSTFEPNTDVKDVFKPDLLMIEQHGSPST